MKILPLNNYNNQYKHNKGNVCNNVSFQRIGKADKYISPIENQLKRHYQDVSSGYVEVSELKTIKSFNDLTFPRIFNFDKINPKFEDYVLDSPGVVTDFVLKDLNDFIDILPKQADILEDNSILKIFNQLFKYRPSELADVYTGYNEYPYGILQIAGRYGSNKLLESLYDYVQIIGNNPQLCKQTLNYLDNLKDTKYGERISDKLTQFIKQKGVEITPVKHVRSIEEASVSSTPVLDREFCDSVKKYNLYEFKDKYPRELSGGMKQRLALIRTLSFKPDILLLDEPFSALDYQTRILISNDVYNIIKEENKTAIIVTHDIDEAISMCNKIIVLTNRPTKILNTHIIKIHDSNNPIDNRKSECFPYYHNLIWKEIEKNV